MNNLQNLVFSLTRSSQDPKKPSMTFNGFLALIIPLAVGFFQSQGLLELDQAFFDKIVNLFAEIIQNVTTLVGMLLIFFGSVRKLYNKVIKGK